MDSFHNSHDAFRLDRAIRRMSRGDLADLCSRLIDRMDAMDADPDLEEGDAEDSFALSHQAQRRHHGPGCPIADSDHTSDDEHCWQPATLNSH